jgi:Spy/CpxP family protein refolding chaperone
MKILSLSVLCLFAVLLNINNTFAFFGDNGKKETKVETTKSRPQMDRSANRGGAFMEELNLTDEQKEKIRKIREASKKNDNKERRDSIRKKRLALEEALNGEAKDEEIRLINKELQVLDAVVNTEKLEQMIQIRNVLTPEQRKKFATLKKQRMAKGMGQKMGQPRGQQGMNMMPPALQAKFQKAMDAKKDKKSTDAVKTEVTPVTPVTPEVK